MLYMADEKVEPQEDNLHKEFQGLVRQRFSEEEGALILEALDLYSEHIDEKIASDLSAAHLLLKQYADHCIIISALLVPLKQKGIIEITEIKKRFGETIASLVEKAYTNEVMRTDTESHRREDLGALLNLMAKDIRVVILLIGIRLDRLNYLALKRQDDLHDIARETLDIYVPIAGKMGMGSMRAALEDVCFRILKPELYDYMNRKLKPILAEDAVFLKLTKRIICSLLENNGIKGSVYGRTKGLYSLYQKMQRQRKSLQGIMDRIGIRIVVPSVKDCYTTLSLVHSRFYPIPRTFDDYIARPKNNGYRSLHTSVSPTSNVSNKPIEIQIRTMAMHGEAEYGIAAHWLYKDAMGSYSEEHKQAQWFKELLSRLENIPTHSDFIKELQRQVSSATSLNGATSAIGYSEQEIDTTALIGELRLN
jgi:guanosine-3',5'-bis(diphosphate) 3'-pyrophosphohydrolase